MTFIPGPVTPRYVCTKDAPWTPDKGQYAEHPDAVEVGDQQNGWPSGDTQSYKCPHCGKYFSVELPQ